MVDGYFFGAGNSNLNFTVDNSAGPPKPKLVPGAGNGKWRHVAAQISGNAMKLFVDGLAAGTGAITPGTTTNNSDLFIGRLGSSLCRIFSGKNG